MVPANQTEESEVRELSGKESGTGSDVRELLGEGVWNWFRNPFLLVNAIQTPLKGVLKLVPDSFLESSRNCSTSSWLLHDEALISGICGYAVQLKSQPRRTPHLFPRDVMSGKGGFSKHAFREVPFGFHRGTAPGCPKNAQKWVQRSVPGTSP